MALKVAFAYAGSAYASMVGASQTGAYIVERDHNVTTGAPLKRPVLAVKVGFADAEKAQKWINGWTRA